ncbi:hypothetical protein [Blastopirellula retiformator]|uniref:YtkA-like domain-containing protein n=1 Tax=Blastopirellula retiformator TaxID=2527970 RepID=A0A5C5VLV0_9BACT|nr:hypothetical protein [Blastopirellula retiformator]TWT38712.1 hypothetical protein Enr8_04060 [Blastopirellula retiformator]
MSPACKIIVAVILGIAYQQAALADGGKVQLRRQMDPYQLTIFTSPTPLRAGPVDISVLVQDAEGQVASDVQIELQLTSESGAILTPPVSQATATNKLLQSAKFVLPEAGVWQVEAEIAGEATVDLNFEITAAKAHSDWQTAGWMLLLPVALVALFILREKIDEGSKPKSTEPKENLDSPAYPEIK